MRFEDKDGNTWLYIPEEKLKVHEAEQREEGRRVSQGAAIALAVGALVYLLIKWI